MVVLIVTSMISSDIDITKFKMNNTTHKANFASYQPTNPPSSLYVNPGNNFVSIGSDEKYPSKQSRSIIDANDGVFFIVTKPTVDKTYYITPQALSLKDESCISGFDFMDISGTGIKQWVFKCDLKNAAIIVTLLAIPLIMIDELFYEIQSNIPTRYPVPVLKQKRSVVFLLYWYSWCVKCRL